MNLEEADTAEKCLLRGIMNVSENISKNKLQPINLNMILYELCWLQIIQMKWQLSLTHLEDVICKSLDLSIFKNISKALSKSDIPCLKLIEEKVKTLQKTQKMQIPLKLHMIMHLACCFIDIGDQKFGRAYLQICIFEYHHMQNQKKSQEDLVKAAELYLARPNLSYIQYEIHYLLKLTSKLSDSMLLKSRPYLLQQEKTPQLISQKISLSTFLSVINCFIGKNSENEDIYDLIDEMQESQLKPYQYILQHLYFWTAMSFFHRKMYQKSLFVFEKARKIKNCAFSISEKVEKNITQLQAYIEKEKSRVKTQESVYSNMK